MNNFFAKKSLAIYKYMAYPAPASDALVVLNFLHKSLESGFIENDFKYSY
jgi:hypothetical protein